METLEESGVDPLEDVEAAEVIAAEDPAAEEKSPLVRAGWIVGAIATLVMAILFDKIRSTVITVAVAVGSCAAIWVGANLLFDQARGRWQRFNTIRFAVLGALLGVVLHGNGLTLGSGGGIVSWILGPLAGAVAFGVLGFALAQIDDAAKRSIVALGSFAAVGAGVGLLLRDVYHPGVDWGATVIATLIVAAIGAGISALLKHPPLHGALVGASLGWILGFWGGADVGDGNVGTALIGTIVPALLVGARVARSTNPDLIGRTAIDQGSRSWIFLGPALLFIAVMLVIPAIRTGYLSLLDRDSERFVGLENYGATFTDKASWDLSGWTNMFTSVPFLIGVVALIAALFLGLRSKRLTGRAIELGNPTVAPLVVGGLLVCFGVFTALRGTIINNLWWVVTVTFFSTALGLAVAVLADNRKGERFAKSIIFMPMALSLVGASIIWRFMYQPRNVTKEQTGLLNALWIGLGRLSTGSGLPTLIFTVLLGLVVLALGAWLARSLVRRAWTQCAVPAILLAIFGWIFLRYAQIIGGGIGGFTYNEDGTIDGKAIIFTQEGPYNNVWLMVIFIWIQVGFAMVILSAAIKAVPTELVEAAQIDGANASQVFWRVTLPQIATTIGVVVTTLIVGVMKVFDIVKVVTNGQFGTQVLANDMFDKSFNILDIGRGAALAMLIFISVLPVMYINIRRMQEEN